MLRLDGLCLVDLLLENFQTPIKRVNLASKFACQGLLGVLFRRHDDGEQAATGSTRMGGYHLLLVEAEKGHFSHSSFDCKGSSLVSRLMLLNATNSQKTL